MHLHNASELELALVLAQALASLARIFTPYRALVWIYEVVLCSVDMIWHGTGVYN